MWHKHTDIPTQQVSSTESKRAVWTETLNSPPTLNGSLSVVRYGHSLSSWYLNRIFAPCLVFLLSVIAASEICRVPQLKAPTSSSRQSFDLFFRFETGLQEATATSCWVVQSPLICSVCVSIPVRPRCASSPSGNSHQRRSGCGTVPKCRSCETSEVPP